MVQTEFGIENMKRFRGRFLVESNFKILNIRYNVINSIEDFEKDCRCIIVRSLNPDYYLLLGSIDLIVTERGSVLSHLAIVARENGIPVFLTEEIISEMPEKGILSIKGDIIEFETNEK